MDSDPLTFWDGAWRGVGHARISAYAARLGPDSDPLIDELKSRGAVSVCDAGCGCGLYALKLARHGFAVSGFDIAPDAVRLTQALFAAHGRNTGAFRTADILRSGYPDSLFDAVIARDVVDHMPLADGKRAVRELLRIVCPGGCVLLTLDASDAEYEAQPHTCGPDGDYFITDGKWKGMVYHPNTEEAFPALAPDCSIRILDVSDGWTLALERKETGHADS